MLFEKSKRIKGMAKMKTDIFYCIGSLIYKLRWFIILLWITFIGISIPFTPYILDPFKEVGFKDSRSQSATANHILNKKLGYSYNQFIVMYSSDKWYATNPKYLDEIKSSLSRIDDIPVKHQIIYPNTANKQISKNKYNAYAVVLFKGEQEADEKLVKAFKAAVKEPANLTMKMGGEPIFLEDTKIQTQLDLYSAEYIATPVAIITMLIVFGSLIAASIPIFLTAISAFLTLMTLFLLGHLFSLSVFTINIALLVGLCLMLDYALLIINRFRDELYLGCSTEEAIAITQATAGKAVFFSALAVFISLSALLLFHVNVLFSVGMGGLAAVLVALATAFILLPAVLSILSKRINLLPIKFIRQNNLQDNPYCRWLVTTVVRFKYAFFSVILVLLLIMGYPFLEAQFGISDFKILPKSLQSRQLFDAFSKNYGETKLSPIIVIVQSPRKDILDKTNIRYLYNFVTKLQDDPRVKSVDSIVSTSPRLTLEQYQMLYTQPNNRLPAEVKKLLHVTTKDDLTSITVVSKYSSYSRATTNLIKELRATKLENNMTIKVTGASANIIDVLQSISKVFFYAFLWIIGFTYITLLFVLRSVVLPLKAIVTTMLSLFASYGILVLVFQMGYLHELLNFEPQGMLDISLLIIIFCALFGISMDYEVFLLTRIKECYEQTGDNIQSIIVGIDKSWKIITSAAIIVIFLCLSFMSADILIVKAFGLGIAIAVAVDAYIIRTILVPATMAILGKWNWYLPKWLDAILPKVSFDPEKYLIKK